MGVWGRVEMEGGVSLGWRVGVKGEGKEGERIGEETVK